MAKAINHALDRLPIGRNARKPLRQANAILKLIFAALRREISDGVWIEAEDVTHVLGGVHSLLAKLAYGNNPASPATEWRMPPDTRKQIAAAMDIIHACARHADELSAEKQVIALAGPLSTLQSIIDDDDRQFRALQADPARRAG